MKKAINIFFIITILTLNACFPSDEGNSNTPYGVIEYNGQEANFVSGSYETTQGKTHIDLIGENFAVSINLESFNEGTSYDLAKAENNLSFFDGNRFIEINEGNIKAENISDNNISGSFSFNYENSAGADICHGYFNGIEKINASTPKAETFTKEKFMFIDGINGKITVEDTECMVKFDDKTFALNINDFPEYSLETALNKVEKEPAAIILHPQKNDIKLISIDKMKNNQLTIVYKNGNSLVLM